MERHVPELYDWVRKKDEAAPVMRCAIFDVVSWFPGVLQQLWIDVSVRCPHAECHNESASEPGVAAVAGEAEKTKRYGTAVRSLVFETCGRLGGEGTKLLCDLVTTAAANGQCSPHAVGRWRTQLERVLLTAQADLRALVPESWSDLLLSLLCLWQSRVCAVVFVWRCLHCDSHVKGSSDRARDRDTDFGCIASCVAIASVLQAFFEIAFTRVDVGMERCSVTSAATLRVKVPGMASSIWIASMRSMQDPVVPQQGHVTVDAVSKET